MTRGAEVTPFPSEPVKPFRPSDAGLTPLAGDSDDGLSNPEPVVLCLTNSLRLDPRARAGAASTPPKRALAAQPCGDCGASEAEIPFCRDFYCPMKERA
jgi:hypothetical protein